MKRNKYKKDIKKEINKRLNIFKVIIYIAFIILVFQISYLIIFKNKHYNALLNKMTSNTYEYASVPRGRIYDRNYNIIVDNQEVATIYYLKPNKIESYKELEYASKVS